MSCDNCHQSAKSKDEQLDTIERTAKAEAIRQQAPMAVYQEAGEWTYGNAFDVFRSGKVVRNVVSQYL